MRGIKETKGQDKESQQNFRRLRETHPDLKRFTCVLLLGRQ